MHKKKLNLQYYLVLHNIASNVELLSQIYYENETNCDKDQLVKYIVDLVTYAHDCSVKSFKK